MNKTYIVIILLILVVVGGMVFMGRESTVEAPQVETTDQMEETNSMDANTNIDVVLPVSTSDDGTSLPAPEVKEFVVSGNNFAFDPSTITVNQGDKVRIVFKNSQGFHDFVIDEYGAATKQTQAPTEEVIEFVADKAGSFEYYCSVGSHRQMGMKGTLVVK